MKIAARLYTVCLIAAALAACGDDDSPAADGGGRDGGGKPMSQKDAGEEDAGVPEPPATPVCSVDNFCWERPTPQGETLRAVWSATPNDVWGVGDGGVVLHYDGKNFRAEHVDAHTDLLAIHGSAANDVWAVGKGGLVLHYDGSAWSKNDLSSVIDASGAGRGVLYGVFAAAPNAVWAVGHTGVNALIIHYDGEKWSSQPLMAATPQVLRAIWGFSADKLWAVGDGGVIRVYDGTQWIADKSPTGGALNAIHGLAAHDVWAVGAGGTAVHWNGTTWTNANMGLSGALFSLQVDIAAPPPVMDAGAPMPAPMPMMDAGMLPPMAPEGPWSVWAFGEKGHVFRYNGTLWAPLASGTEAPFYAATRLREASLIAVGEHGQVSRFQADSRQSLSGGSRRNHLGVWGDGKTMWVVGDEIERHDANGWQTMTSPTERALYGVWGDKNGIWAVGTAGTVVRYENGMLQTREVSAAGDAWLHAVWGAANTVWIVGDAGLTLVAAAGSFIKVATPVRSNLSDVWGIADDAFWAVGDGGSVLRWDGMAWLRVPTGPMGGVVTNLRAVWGSGRDDVWVVGTEGTILHWNGERFSAMSQAGGFSLNDVWGRSASEIYAVGSGGTALRYDGSQWNALQTGTLSSLQSVFGDDQGRVFAVGLDGVVLVLAN
jgi:hypothetical protein